MINTSPGSSSATKDNLSFGVWIVLIYFSLSPIYLIFLGIEIFALIEMGFYSGEAQTMRLIFESILLLISFIILFFEVYFLRNAWKRKKWIKTIGIIVTILMILPITRMVISNISKFPRELPYVINFISGRDMSHPFETLFPLVALNMWVFGIVTIWLLLFDKKTKKNFLV